VSRTERLVKNAVVPWKLVEDDAILLDLDEGEVVRLNAVGAAIWSAIDGTRTLDDLTAHVEHVFDVSRWRAGRDVRRFVGALRRLDFVRAVASPSAGPR